MQDHSKILTLLVAASLVALLAGSANAQVTSLGTVTCPRSAPAGSVCTQYSIVTPHAPVAINATVAVATPSGSVLGTIPLMSGGGGTGFLTGAPYANFPTAFLSYGFRVILVEWATSWEAGAGGLANAIERPSALLDYFVAQYGHPFCPFGHSAGASQVAGWMVQGDGALESEARMLANGPAYDDFFHGCVDPTTSKVQVCPGFSNGYAYNTPGLKSNVNGFDGTTTCGNHPSAGDENIWEVQELDIANGVYTWPGTTLSYNCTQTNVSSGQGALLLEKLTNPLGDLACDTTCPDAETYWYNSTNFNRMVSALVGACHL